MIKLPKEPARASLAEPRPGTNYGYDNLTMDPTSVPRQHVDVPDWHFENVSLDVPVSVAKVALHKEIDRLKRKVEATADDLSRPLFNQSGNPYAVDINRAHEHMASVARAELESVKSQLKELESLTTAADADIVRWAVDNNKVARHVSGGWAIV